VEATEKDIDVADVELAVLSLEKVRWLEDRCVILKVVVCIDVMVTSRMGG